MNRNRTSSGNMLVLVSLTIGLVIAIGVGGFLFNNILFQRARAQYKTDSAAFSMASEINSANRVGKLNQLMQDCRELVFDSRQNLEKCNSDQELAFLAPLCEQLVDEARTNHALLEDERKNQIRVITKESQHALSKYNDGTSSESNFSLQWLQTYEPKISDASLGRIAGVNSNVTSTVILADLLAHDTKSGYLDSASKYFKANVDARLPMPDSDLHFKISALPPSVHGTCPPARNTNPEVFISSASIFKNGVACGTLPEYAPAAIQVSTAMEARVGANQAQHATLTLRSQALTTGARAELLPEGQ